MQEVAFLNGVTELAHRSLARAEAHARWPPRLGWMLDSMDVMLYALVLGQVQREMHLSAALSGAMMSATLDLRGRRRPRLRLVC